MIGGDGEGRIGDDIGDGGPAVNAWIYKPSDIAVDAQGNVYIADTNNDRVRRIDTDGTITTIAGGGEVALDDAVGGPATEADWSPPNQWCEGRRPVRGGRRAARAVPGGRMTAAARGPW